MFCYVLLCFERPYKALKRPYKASEGPPHLHHQAQLSDTEGLRRAIVENMNALKALTRPL